MNINRTGKINCKTHHTTSLIVVQIHLFAQCPATFTSIHEFTWKFKTEANVIRTTTPFPVTHSRRHWTYAIHLRRAWLMAVVTCARLNWTLAAGTSYWVCHCGAGDGVDECCFSTTWNETNRSIFYYYYSSGLVLLISVKLVTYSS